MYSAVAVSVSRRPADLGARINQLKNLLIGQAYARNRALLAQLVDVQQNRQHGGRPSPGVGAGVFGHHAQQRIAYGERGGETVGDISSGSPEAAKRPPASASAST